MIKKLWIYLAILLVIGGLWGAVEFYWPQKTEETKQPLLFPNLNPATILEIRWQRGDQMIQAKRLTSWAIIHPISVPADTKVMEGLLHTLSTLRPEGRFSAAGKDLSEFGLKAPQLKISFLFDGKWKEMELGEKNALGMSRYGKLSMVPEVFLLGDYISRELDRDLLTLRDKRVFSLDQKQVQALVIKTDNKPFSFARDSKGWNVKTTPEKRVITEKVETFLSDLFRLQAKGFGQSDQKKFNPGISASRIQLTLMAQGKDGREETLILGKEEPGKGFWAKSPLHKETILLEPTFLKNIPKGPEEWEEKASPAPAKKGP